MATIHFIQQSKGGVGKSMLAAMMHQALTHYGKTTALYDIDPSNATLHGYKEFPVNRLEIMVDGNINRRKFDKLIYDLNELPTETHAIVDSGASSFIALGKYLMDENIPTLLAENGHFVLFHTIMVGGQGMSDTVNGLRSLALGFPETPIVVWLNTHFGEIEMDDKGFEEFTIYQEFHKQFHAVISLPKTDAETTGKDLEILFAKRQSFKTAIDSSQSIVVRSRLNRYWQRFLAVVDQAAIAV
jgi:hypothetical protein